MTSTSNPKVLISGFADEAAIDKTVDQQFSAFAALGLRQYSIRFIDAGNGIKNVMQLNDEEIAFIKQRQEAYGLKVSSLGSPIGKVKLLDQDDGSNNRYVPFKEYLSTEVARACELAHAFETKLIRGFSFYHPRGTDPAPHIDQVVDHLGEIADMCQKANLIFGLEIEANLVGQSGQILKEVHQKLNHPSVKLIFDAANITTQGCSATDVYDQYEAMKPGLGWMHIKDYKHPSKIERTTHVDEEALKHFVPADIGDSGHEAILRDFRNLIPSMEADLAKIDIPGVYLDLEPHVKGGGQFGGFSGPDGFGESLRGLIRVLDYVGIDNDLRDFAAVQNSRGF